MAQTVYNEFHKYMKNLAATNAACVTLGTRFSASTNLFIGSEQPEAATCCTIIPYPGGPPSIEGDRQEAALQIRLKCRSTQTALKTQQDLINLLHNNTKVCASTNGRVSAVQSAPILLGYEEAAEYTIVVSNYTVKYVKI